MSRRVTVIVLLTVTALVVSACASGVDVTDVPATAGSPEAPSVPEGSVKSAKAREAAPDVPASDVAELVAGNSSFAFDLYRVLAGSEGNFFYSPYSISAALAMTYAGARADTERDMAEALHFLLSQERLHPAFNGLDQELAGRGEGAEGKDDKGFRLNVVNAIWGQAGYRFLDEFLDVLAENYGAGLRVLDFATAPEAARLTINDWVAEQTEGRIKDLIPAGIVDATTRLVLTNAVYFNAAWAFPFPPERTADGVFHPLDGGDVTVPMMRQSEAFGYASGPGYQAVELPYDGRELSMVILLPDQDEFEAIEESLDAEMLKSVITGVERRQVDLTMPTFEFESEFSLNDALAALGMGVAFSGDSDFSGMTGGRDLLISDVVHKAFVAVDEAGTEAAAATAVVMREMAVAPDETIEVVVNRPFIFAIRDISTGAILSIGRVVDPRA